MDTAFQMPNNNGFQKFANLHGAVVEQFDVIAGSFTELLSSVRRPGACVEQDTIFYLSSASYNEYEEVMILAMTGYGSGATKLLRALYERVVTTMYLMKNPNKVQQFKDYTLVHWSKLLKEADANGVTDELSPELREQYTDKCKKCEEPRLQGAWTKKPIHTQAGEVDKHIRKLGFHAYLMPTLFLHTTDWGMNQQTAFYGDGKRMLAHPRLEWHHAFRAIVIGTDLISHFALGFDTFFKLNQEETCVRITGASQRIGEILPMDLARSDAPSPEA
jgi:hypothetical protein